MLHTDAGGVCARQPTVSPLAQDHGMLSSPGRRGLPGVLSSTHVDDGHMHRVAFIHRTPFYRVVPALARPSTAP